MLISFDFNNVIILIISRDYFVLCVFEYERTPAIHSHRYLGTSKMPAIIHVLGYIIIIGTILKLFVSYTPLLQNI